MLRLFASLRVLRGYSNMFLAAVLAVLCIEPGLGRSHASHHAPSGPDAEYVSALATANQFLNAWQTHDEETGLLLLTAAAKKRSSEEKVSSFFAVAPLASYEIGRGKRLRPGVYLFPLALYASGGEKKDSCRPRYSNLHVVKTGKEDWAIDTLP